jgi:hypothetical protein
MGGHAWHLLYGVSIASCPAHPINQATNTLRYLLSPSCPRIFASAPTPLLALSSRIMHEGNILLNSTTSKTLPASSGAFFLLKCFFKFYGMRFSNSVLARNFFYLALQPNSGLSHLYETFRFTSVTTSRTVGRTPWTGDQLVARPLYLYTNTEKRTHNTNTKHPCPEWDSNIWSRGPRERRQFMPQTARLPWPASVRASEDSPCLRPLGYRDRRLGITCHNVIPTKIRFRS